MGSIPVPVPPLEDQKRIELEIEDEMESSDSVASILGRHCDLLLERRQALITAAVVGEVAIPGVAA
jgi:type I restriction enzyme S subunit